MAIKRNVEMKITGWHSAQAVAKLRPQEVVRAYVTQATLRDFSPLLKFLAAHGNAYHIVEHAELDKIAESVHHEGICLLAKQLPILTSNDVNFEKDILAASTRKKTIDSPFSNVVLVLEDVDNPHNFGAICRVAAHFGVKSVCVLQSAESKEQASKLFRLQGAHYRTAEGALEFLKIVELLPSVEGTSGNAKMRAGQGNAFHASLEALKNAGFTCVGTTGNAKIGVTEGVKILVEKKCEKIALLFGNEKFGLHESTLKACDLNLKISGSGLVESLNVACAVSAVMASVLGT